MEISQELAQRLLHEGATCVCLGVPLGTEFGVDMKSWTTAERFNGLKMIPPGIHFIHYSATNPHGDAAPRVGFIYNFRKSQVLVKKWDDEKENLVDDTSNTDETIKTNLKDMDRFLGPYPFEIWERWKNLSGRITEDLVTKLLPASGIVRSALELTGTLDKERKDAEELSKSQGSSPEEPKRQRRSRQFTDFEKCDDLLPNLKAVEGTELRFSKIPEQCYPEGSTPSEVTRHSLDSSYLFEQVLLQHQNSNDIIGEVQFAFICFLIGHSLEAFEHWKRLVGIFCSCDEALVKHHQIFSDFLTVLNHQLHEIPEDFLVDIVASSNFVYNCLRNLFRTLHSSEACGRLKSKAKRLQENLTEKFLWDFSNILDEDEEDLPVVVET